MPICNLDTINNSQVTIRLPEQISNIYALIVVRRLVVGRNCCPYFTFIGSLVFLSKTMFFKSYLDHLLFPRPIYCKSMLSKHLPEIWFERNQRVFHDKSLQWVDHFEAARINGSSWCSFSKLCELFHPRYLFELGSIGFFFLNFEFWLFILRILAVLISSFDYFVSL